MNLKWGIKGKQKLENCFWTRTTYEATVKEIALMEKISEVRKTQLKTNVPCSPFVEDDIVLGPLGRFFEIKSESENDWEADKKLQVISVYFQSYCNLDANMVLIRVGSVCNIANEKLREYTGTHVGVMLTTYNWKVPLLSSYDIPAEILVSII